MPYLSDVDTECFDWRRYLGCYHEKLLRAAAGRVAITRRDPLAFALLYLRRHLASLETGGEVTLSAFHAELFRHAFTWTRSYAPRECRTAWVAPRSSGKSTLGFLVLPLWALAHGHRKFIAAFADSGPQAQQHLATLKRELDTNALLRNDFPDLVQPAMRERGTTVADRQDTYLARSGVAFMAKGIDSSTLGAKIGNQRPDLLLFDDIEPDESNYSVYQKGKRLSTVIDAVFPMNLSAAVMFLGTTTMAGSIIHDLVRQVTDSSPPEWPSEERVDVRYFLPILTREDGSEVSLWPQRWSLEFLQSIRGTRSYLKNFLNQPAGVEGGYWTAEDFTYGQLPAVTRTLLSLDPSTTTGTRSDPAGIAVVGFAPPPKKHSPAKLAELLAAAPSVAARRELVASYETGRCVVRMATTVRLVGDSLRSHLLRTLAKYPEVRLILVESNQGGEHWHSILHDMPVKVVIFANTVPKEVRAADLLHHYQMGRVTHDGRLVEAEGEMEEFPHGTHDDLVDAVGNGVFRFIPAPSRSKPVKVTSRSTDYA